MMATDTMKVDRRIIRVAKAARRPPSAHPEPTL